MKKKVLALAVIAICLSILTMGTLAYFTAEERAHNIIATGGVDVTINEWADEAKTEAFSDVTGVMPGVSVTKIVELENTGASDAWVRIRVTKAIQLAEGVTGDVDLSLVVLDIDTANWTEQDGWYYYNSALKPGETTAPLFTCATFATDMGNLYQGSTATVDVIAQAVQTANNGSSALDAAGWPALS